jgi:GNAT superfamily N-acetyltransferase
MPATAGTTATIRPATTDDIDDLIRLRVLMLDATGTEPASPERWRKTAEAQFDEWITEGTAGVFVAESPGGRVVACGTGIIDTRLPGPRTPQGQHGFISSMATDPDWRRQGLAQAIVEVLLDWFVTRGVDRVNLHASDAGAGVYRRLGFVEGRHPDLRWHRPGS